MSKKLLANQLAPWLLLAFFLRLLLMPFTAHSDLLSVYGRAYLILEKGGLGLFGLNTINLLHAGFLLLLKPFLAYKVVFNHYNLLTFTENDWLGFINQPGIFRVLFFFKLPYLIFEVLAILLLFKTFANSPYKNKIIKFWLFNPVIIFATYIFGRFDIIVILLLLLAVWAAKLNRPYRAVIALGLATVLRLYPVILLLPFTLIFSQKTRERWGLFLAGLAPFFLSLLAESFNRQSAASIKDITGLSHLSYPLAMRFSFEITPYDNLYVFVFIYVLLIFYLFLKPQSGFANLVSFSLYVMLAFFATSFFHPHYFSWLLPFLIFFIQDKTVANFYWLQVGSWLVYTFQWGRPLAAYLIAPLSPAFFWSLPAPIELIEKVMPVVQLIGVGRTVFSASSLVLIYLVYKQAQATTLSSEILTKQEVKVET